jgi:hypothetical protein
VLGRSAPSRLPRLKVRSGTSDGRPVIVTRAFARVARRFAPAPNKLLFALAGPPQPAAARNRPLADKPASEPDVTPGLVERVEQLVASGSLSAADAEAIRTALRFAEEHSEERPRF